MTATTATTAPTTTTATTAPATPHALSDHVRALLASHVPLSLLLDLADPTGPHSRELLAAEPGGADWLPAR